MYRTALLSLVLGLPSIASAGGAVLTASGSCPGPVDISAAGLTPNSRYAFLVSREGEGVSRLSGGFCDGTVVGLARAKVAFHGNTDGAGSLSFTPSVPDGACGITFQIIDLATCGLTNVETFAGDPPGGDIVYGVDGQCSGTGSVYTLDMTTGVTTPVMDIARTYTGVTVASNGLLYGITDDCTGSGDIYELNIEAGTETFIFSTGMGEPSIASVGMDLFANGYHDEFSWFSLDTMSETSAGILGGTGPGDLCCHGHASHADASGVIYGFVSGGIVPLDGDAWGVPVITSGGAEHTGFIHNGETYLVGDNDVYILDAVAAEWVPTGISFSMGNIDGTASPTP
ncbi:MAG: hypothetical protein ACI8PZ_003891 [Myxococcota bacterium]|jgi:hypothetical protein